MTVCGREPQSTTEMGNRLNTYAFNSLSNKRRHPKAGGDDDASLLFCGYLEGDFSERSYLQTPIAFSGGFVLRTPVANILFDPGSGTITGLRDLGFNINDIDIIIVSHYHPSARFDLHTILNELGGFCPGRAYGNFKKNDKKVYLFASRALIQGRGEPEPHHPPVLIPSDLEALADQSAIIARPGNCWIIEKSGKPEKGVIIRQQDNKKAAAPDCCMILKTFIPGSIKHKNKREAFLQSSLKM